MLVQVQGAAPGSVVGARVWEGYLRQPLRHHWLRKTNVAGVPRVKSAGVADLSCGGVLTGPEKTLETMARRSPSRGAHSLGSNSSCPSIPLRRTRPWHTAADA